MALNTQILNKTSLDTIAVFVKKTNVVNTILGINVPLILSTGAGLERLISFDIVPPHTQRFNGLNQTYIDIVKSVVATGTITLSPQSSAISAIRNILTFQSNNLITIKGTAYILNFNALIMNKINDFTFINEYSSSNRARTLTDIDFQFQYQPSVEEVNLGSIASGLAQLGLLGISI